MPPERPTSNPTTDDAPCDLTPERGSSAAATAQEPRVASTDGGADDLSNPFAEEGRRSVRFSGGIGVGKPFEDDDRRDFTVKASRQGENSRREFTVKAIRRPAPPPPRSSPLTAPTAIETSLTRSNSMPIKSPAKPRHRHNSSTSSTSSSHAQIPAPEYPVRSQFGVHGLHRSSSSMELPMAPTISGGIARRMSLSSSEGGSGAEDDDGRMNRPIKHRSESLPTFPPSEELDASRSKSRGGLTLADLPKNPKVWMPSHLSVYIAHALDLHTLLEQDITAFIRESRLSGRAFLRLRDDDMATMGINIRWRPLLSEARDRLRREALGGKIWGFEGVRYGDNEGWDSESSAKAQSVIGLFAPEDEDKDAWKQSWRKSTDAQTRGRVRGIAMAFEAPPALPTSESSTSLASNRSSTKRNSIVIPTRNHGRSDSVNSSTSAASVDSGGGSARSVSSFDFDISEMSTAILSYSPDTPYETPPEQYQANMASHLDDDVRPYQLVRRPSTQTTRGRSSGLPEVDSTLVRGSDGRMSVHDLAFAVSSPDGATDESDSAEPTIKSPVGKGSTFRPNSGLEDLFGIDTRRTESDMQRIVEEGGDEQDLMAMQVGGRKGSMVFVKKSQLEALQQRLDEVEGKLAEALASKSEPAADDIAPAKAPANLGTWLISSFSRTSADNGPQSQLEPVPMSWTGLGGYVLAASLGIGIVCGEVVVSKMFGYGGRR